MARLGFAERSDLVQWGVTRGAAADLPQLVRRLIIETSSVVKLDVAAAEGVTSGGWDGTVRATSASVHVPDGLSLWEMSNRGSPEKKADDDYDKRLATPDGSPTADAVYIAVTSRPWPKREAWATRRTDEGRWREVCAYGVDNLSTWLEDAPVTHAWISELVGLHPHGLITAQTWWQGWTAQTDPAFPAPAVLGGREKAATTLRELFAGAGQVISLATPSRDDALAFVSALAVGDADMDGGALLARMAFVDRVEAWRRLREHSRRLVLVALTPEVAEAMTPGSAHHLIIPVVGSSDGDVTLEPVDAQGAAAALKSAGLGEERSDEVGQLARLSLLAGRRRIAVKRELHRPPWALPPVEKIVRRAILLGRFSEGADGDRTVVAKVLGFDFDAAAEQLSAHTVSEDPLLARLGSSLGVVSPFDAWLLTRASARPEDLEALHKAAITVLTEIDPAYELERSERWLAGVRGKVRAYSGDLRQGLATSLALLGGHGGGQIAGTSLTASEWAGWIVREIFAQANKDKSCHLWASLGDVLSLLAEAAPDEFVAAVRDGLAGESPLLAGMFEDNDDTSAMFASSSHSSLLWALEIVSWSPKHLGHVVDLLARLDGVDPGGKLGNRPQGSLLSIFRPWFPQSNASAERRLDVLDGLRERHPGVAWTLMLSLLLERHGFAMHMSGPRYRDWKPVEISPTRAEYGTFLGELFGRVLEDAGEDVERLTPLIDGLPNLPPDARGALLDRLDEVADRFDDDSRAAIWSVMRAEAAKNREYAEAQWALPEVEVERLEALTALYQPQAAAVRLKWLFDEHLPTIPGLQRGHGLDEYAPAIDDLREQAAREVAAETDWDGLSRFAREVKLPWFLGSALAQVGVVEYEPKLLELLDADDWADFNLASSYFGRRFRQAGVPWLDEVLDNELTSRQHARLLLATDDHPTSWERAHAAGEDVAAAFWSEFPRHGLGHEFPYVDLVAGKLIEFGRVGAGLDLLNLYTGSQSGPEWAELVAGGLELLLERPDDPDLKQLSQYGLRNLFEYLERSGLDEARLARLEWSYLPTFGYDAAPPTLSRHLAASPEFFADAIARVYRPGDEDDDEDAEGTEEKGEEVAGADGEAEELSEQDVAIASNAYHLLSEWRTLPGRDGNEVDAEVLTRWVEGARELLKESQRLRVGDLQIGKVLASCPPDSDGWPCRATRDLLERVQSPEIERGFEMEIFASLGVTTRGVLDGGDQERDRGARYREQAERFYDRWPRTAAVLNEAADSFDRAARRHDSEAERRRTGFDR